MSTTLFSNLFSLRSVIGLDAELSGESRLLSSCRLVIKGKLLSAFSAHSGLKSVLHFAKQYQGGEVALNIRGKGVLVRNVDQLGTLDQQGLHRIMPGATLEDFYHQLSAAEGGGTRLCLIRKTEADALIKELAEQGYAVVALSLNPEPENAAYQAGFALLLGELAGTVDLQQVAASRQQAYAKAKLKGVAILAAPVLLVLLVLNFLLLNHYSALLQTCQIQTDSSAARVDKFQAMERRLLTQTSLVRGLGWTAGMRYGILTDRLLSKVPASVSLQQVIINPLALKAASSGQVAVRQSNTAIVSGSSASAAGLNDWLFELRSLPRVAGCTIDNYAVNADSGLGQFLMTIHLSDDKL